MAALWASSDVEQWQAQLDGYWEALNGLKKDKIVQLDRWFQEELPETLSSREPAHLTQPELVKLVDWKMTRGKRRPKLLDYAKAAEPAAVKAASTAAFGLLAPHHGKDPPTAVIKEALAALTVLKGVGPATASAILAAHDPSIPFTSDEAMLAALSSKDYTVPKVIELMAALRGKAKQLSEAGSRQWSAKDVERCLYAAAVAATGGGGGEALAAAGGSKAKAGGKKRKR